MFGLSAMGKNCDYVVMLSELGKEQKFEVTYVEVEEKNDEDQTQCLVQLSTLPVAVSTVLVRDPFKKKKNVTNVTSGLTPPFPPLM